MIACEDASTKWRDSGARYDRILVIVATILSVLLLFSVRYLFHFISRDLVESYLPWLNHIVVFGRWRSVEGSWTNYNPPYIYNLILFSWLSRVVSPVVVIKAASLPYFAGAAWLFRSICLASGCTRHRANLAFWIALVAPEACLNTLQWGQCDIQSTAVLLLFARLLLARRFGWAMAAYGLALCFKLQVIFVGPVLLVLLLGGELPWLSLPAMAAAYLVLLVPARLAGRALHELLGIYLHQYGTYEALTMGASNPYMLLQPVLHYSQAANARLTRPALLAAGLVIAGLVLFLFRRRPLLLGDRLIAAMALSMTVAPFVLPKMHDRYFFAGNTMVLLLAMIRPRMALAAVCSQIAAVMTYYPYLYHPYLDSSTCEPMWYWAIAVGLNGLSIVLVGRELYRSSTDRASRGEAAGEMLVKYPLYASGTGRG